MEAGVDRSTARDTNVRQPRAEPLRSIPGTGAKPPADSRILDAFADAAIGMALVSTRGRFLHVNDALCALLGRSEPELLALGVRDVTHPDDLAESRRLTESALHGDTRSFSQEKRYVHPDGTEVSALLTATLVPDENGAPLYFFAQIQDVTARRAAESARDVTEQRNQTLIGSLPDVVGRCTRDGVVVDVGGGSDTPTPVPIDEIAGQHVASFLPPETAELLLETIRLAIETATTHQIEYSLAIGGQLHRREARIAPIPERDEALVIIRDVSERRRAEQALEQRDAILEATARMAALLLERSLDACADEVLALLGTAAAASRSALSEVRERDGDRIYVMTHQWCAPGTALGPPAPLEIGSLASPVRLEWNTALARGEPQFARIDEFPAAVQEEFRAVGVLGAIEAPILVDGELWGTLCLDTATARAWSPAEVDAVRLAASMLAGAVRREGAVAALTASELRYREMVETTSEGAWVVTLEGTVTFANAQMGVLLGRSPGQIVGRSMYEFIAPESQERVRRGLARRALGESARYELSLLRPDGSQVWGVVSASPIRDSAGAVAGSLGMVTDISERVLAERALRRRDAILEAVSRSARLLLERPVTDCVDDILRLLGEATGSSRCSFFERVLLDGTLRATMRNEWTAPGIQPTLTAWQDLPLDDPRLARIAALSAAGEIMLVRLSDLADAATIDLYASEGILTELETPIVVDGEVWGSIGFEDCETERDWQPIEIDALLAAAGVLGAAIARARATAALEESEAQLRQAQKMDAVGRLAGGIAHDFNNVLTAITGYSDLVLERVAADEQARSDVEAMRKAADRAGSLTAQLLAFSRRQILDPRVVELNAVVAETEALIRRLIPESVRVSTTLADDAGWVRVDAGQLQHALINLVVNARDAMPHGGDLAIRTVPVVIDERERELPPGPYALLTVSDTGTGMSLETAASIFEPFFTTKDHGSGLGLSTAYGVIRQSGGDVQVETEPGVGTTFSILLPRVSAVSGARAVEPPAPECAAQGTILLVEDDDAVRDLVRDVLVRAGYLVVAAEDGRRARELAVTLDSPPDLLLSDVVMPGLGGPQLARELTARWPSLPVILISGYVGDPAAVPAELTAGGLLVNKPFTPAELVAAVGATLGAARAAAAT